MALDFHVNVISAILNSEDKIICKCCQHVVNNAITTSNNLLSYGMRITTYISTNHPC